MNPCVRIKFTCFVCQTTSDEDRRGGWSSIKDRDGNVWSACPDHATLLPINRPLLMDSDFPFPVPLNPDEGMALSNAIAAASQRAIENAPKRPKMTTLCEEFAEAVLASRGKHKDSLEEELLDIAGVCINMIAQINLGKNVANLRTER